MVCTGVSVSLVGAVSETDLTSEWKERTFSSFGFADSAGFAGEGSNERSSMFSATGLRAGRGSGR